MTSEAPVVAHRPEVLAQTAAGGNLRSGAGSERAEAPAERARRVRLLSLEGHAGKIIEFHRRQVQRRDEFLRESLGLKEDEIQRVSEAEDRISRIRDSAQKAHEPTDRLDALVGEERKNIEAVIGRENYPRYEGFVKESDLELVNFLHAAVSAPAKKESPDPTGKGSQK